MVKLNNFNNGSALSHSYYQIIYTSALFIQVTLFGFPMYISSPQSTIKCKKTSVVAEEKSQPKTFNLKGKVRYSQIARIFSNSHPMVNLQQIEQVKLS